MGGVLRRARKAGKISGPGLGQQGGCVMVSVLFGGLCFELGGWFRVQHGHHQRLVIVRAAVDGLAVQVGFQLAGQGVCLAGFFG